MSNHKNKQATKLKKATILHRNEPEGKDSGLPKLQEDLVLRLLRTLTDTGTSSLSRQGSCRWVTEAALRASEISEGGF